MSGFTKFERARLLGARALQLSLGAPPLVKVPATVIDPYTVALKELEEKKLPLVIVRYLSGGQTEVVSA
ncbi:MAG: DNA-directed RNA polymerase subunit K [Candidatus Diapherotrites archaeon]|nr:DNA-directed RNA polymerase subunit K [Candidatus Diapherotrites archaeon]